MIIGQQKLYEIVTKIKTILAVFRFYNSKFQSTSLILLTLIILSCSYSTSTIKGKGNIKLKRIDYSQLKDWEEDDHSEALLSFINSCNKFELMGGSRQIGGQIGDITVSDFRDVCEIASIVNGMNQKQVKNFFDNWFVPFEVLTKDNREKGLFTGYYEPELKGSKTKNEIYKYPVYGRPNNLTNDLYYSRKEIENDALRNKELELLYVNDKVDLFFMHIQGSGRVILDDGVTIQLSYAGKNNQPYTSIGSYMLENNIIKKSKASYYAIKSWLKNNPEKAKQIMNINDSYIFFKISDKEYVTGAAQVPLTPQRSLAIDSDILPYGFPIWLESKIKPEGKSAKPFRKLLVTQDTGSAIKGTIRGDVFFGRGKDAEELAAGMNSIGKYFILLPANIVDKFIDKNK